MYNDAVLCILLRFYSRTIRCDLRLSRKVKQQANDKKRITNRLTAATLVAESRASPSGAVRIDEEGSASAYDSRSLPLRWLVGGISVVSLSRKIVPCSISFGIVHRYIISPMN